MKNKFLNAAGAFTFVLSSVFSQSVAAGCKPEHKAYIAINAENKDVLVEEKADQKIQPASMTKMMSLLLVYEAVQEELLSWKDSIYIINDTYLREDMEYLSKWKGRITLGDAVVASGVKSYNDVMATLAATVSKARGVGNSESAFVQLMNKRAVELGMGNTVFYNATGLPTPLVQLKDKGSTVRDMALLLQYISETQPELAKVLGTAKTVVKKRSLANTNSLLRHETEYTDIIGKTGYTCKAGRALTVKVTSGENEVVVSYVGGRSASIREADVLNILKEAFSKIHLAIEPQGPPAPIRVQSEGGVLAVNIESLAAPR